MIPGGYGRYVPVRADYIVEFEAPCPRCGEPCRWLSTLKARELTDRTTPFCDCGGEEQS